jgi:short-subunit dehydrogenase
MAAINFCSGNSDTIPLVIQQIEKAMITANQYGPWALIAGGSEGIGASFAGKLAHAGINLVLIARRVEPLDEIASKLRTEAGVQVRTLQLDLSATRPDLLERIRQITDDIDVGLLIYNAADTGHIKPFLEQTLDQAVSSVRLIALSQATLAHHFGSKMAQRGRGGILLLGSLTGNVGSANLATYGGAKAFTQNFGEALWAELKPHGIDVLVLIVGATDTPARARSGAKNAMTLTPADDVAQSGLDNLAKGPVYVMPLMSTLFQQLCSWPRQQAVERMRQSTPVPKPITRPS